MRIRGGFEEPEESNEKTKDKEPIEIFLDKAVNSTRLKIYWRTGRAGAAINGKSAEDFVQDAIVDYLERRRENLNFDNASVLKALYNRILNKLRWAFGCEERKFFNESISSEKNTPEDRCADMASPPQSKLTEKEISEKRTCLLDKFISTLLLEKKRAINVIIKVNVVKMLRLLTPFYKKILRVLVELGYLDQGHVRTDICFNLLGPTQLRNELPQMYRALAPQIYHVLKGDQFANTRYLKDKLKISYRETKILYYNLRKEFKKFLINEIKNGNLSELSEFDRIEILGNWNGKHIIKSHDKKKCPKR
jgi:hypothetical protein